jgi:transcriptional regulator with XRE-family HTH domain
MVAIVEVVKTLRVSVPGLGERIKQARQARVNAGFSMTEIAASAGMSVQNWYRIEKERQSLPIETLQLIEDALQFSFGINFDD